MFKISESQALKMKLSIYICLTEHKNCYFFLVGIFVKTGSNHFTTMSDHCTVAHTYGDEGVGVLSALVAGVHLHLYPEIHLAWRSTKVPCTQEANKTPLLSSILKKGINTSK